MNIEDQLKLVSQLDLIEGIKAGAFQVDASDIPTKPAITALTPTTVANATDEATAIALVNDLKVKVNAIIAALKS